jgi:hypothetical protein
MNVTFSVPLWAVILGGWSLGGLLFSQLAVALDSPDRTWIGQNAPAAVRYTTAGLLLFVGGPILWILILIDSPDRYVATLHLVPGRVVLFRGSRRGFRTGNWMRMPVYYRDGKLRIGTARTGLLLMGRAEHTAAAEA